MAGDIIHVDMSITSPKNSNWGTHIIGM